MDQLEVVVHADHVDVLERLVVAPVAGVFRPRADGPGVAAAVEVGQHLGTIERLSGDEEVVSPHAGRLMGLLVVPGERVRDRQPVAWVRVPDAPAPPATAALAPPGDGARA